MEEGDILEELERANERIRQLEVLMMSLSEKLYTASQHLSLVAERQGMRGIIIAHRIAQDAPKSTISG